MLHRAGQYGVSHLAICLRRGRADGRHVDGSVRRANVSGANVLGPDGRSKGRLGRRAINFYVDEWSVIGGLGRWGGKTNGVLGGGSGELMKWW